MYNVWGKVNYINENNQCQGYAGGWYIPYFKQVDPSSSTSRWSKEAYDIDHPAEGYHSFDIEDYYILTAVGSYRKGTDRIYLPYYWNENDDTDKDINSPNITHIAFIDHLIIAGSDGPEINFCLAPVKKPTVTYTLPAIEVKTNTDVSMSETSSLNPYTVTVDACGKKYTNQIMQLNSHNGLTIFKNYKLTQSIFDWGDGSVVTVDKTGNGTTNSTHRYTTPGRYTIKTRVNTGFNSSFSEKTQQIAVRYNEPIVDFKWTSSNGLKGQSDVSFTNTTTNAPDNRQSLYTYTWEISDKTLAGIDASVSFIGKPFTFSPVYNFKSPGLKTIKLTCNWNDGIDAKTTVKTYTLTVNRYASPVPDFIWNSINGLKGQESVTFTNKTTKDAQDTRPIEYTYDWILYDTTIEGTTSNYTVDAVSLDYIVNYSYKSPGNKNIKLICNWNDGFEDQIVEKTKSLIISRYNAPIVDFTWSAINGIKGNNEISFANTSTKDVQDIRELEHKYDWILYDSTILGDISNYSVTDVLKAYIVNYSYKSSGNKEIKLICNWNDGFEDQTLEKIKSFELAEFSVTAVFSWDKICKNRSENVTFMNQSTGDVTKIISYKWDIEDSYPAPTDSFYVFSNIEPSRFNEGSPDNTREVINNKSFITPNATLNFHSNKTKNVKLTVTYFTGWENKTSILQKEYTPTEHTLTAKLSASTLTPIGRKSDVEFDNVTIDPDTLQYFYDLSISDFYSACNIDNPTGNIKDNFKKYERVNIESKIKHAFQNTETNAVDMRVYFDNGWGRKYIDSKLNITPKKFIAPVANFNWDIANIYNRNTLITFNNISTDTHNIIRSCTWTIIDEYDMYNPDNPKYGVSVVDNTKKHINVNFEYKPTHKFQSNKQHNITLDIEYDDGFCIDYTTLTKSIDTKININVVPNFDVYFNSQILTTDSIPGSELKYVLLNDKHNIKSVHWEFNDTNYVDASNNITEITSMEDVLFTWKYATRKPLCVDSTTPGVQKHVSVYVLYDNGWTDTNISNTTKKLYNVLTNELTNIQVYADNVDYPEDTNIYGKEKVHIYNTFTQLFNLETIFEWTIDEFVTDKSHFEHSFTSAGLRDIELVIYFDDGFGNIYEMPMHHSVNVLKYLMPDLDFSWKDINLFVGSAIEFTSTNVNNVRPYAAVNYIKVDYYNDGIFDQFDIDGDDEYESDTLPVNTPWWNTFKKNADPLNIRVVGYWNDGFIDNTIEVVKSIVIADLPPTCILNVHHIANGKYRLNIDTDSDSTELQYKFEVYFKSPVVDTDKCKDINDMDSSLPICSIDNPFGLEYFLVYTSNWIVDSEKWISAASSGKYKVVGYIKNSAGESFDEKYFEIAQKSGDGTIIQCSRQCITGIVKKYTYQTLGEKKW